MLYTCLILAYTYAYTCLVLLTVHESFDPEGTIMGPSMRSPTTSHSHRLPQGQLLIELDDGKIYRNPIFDGKNHGFL